MQLNGALATIIAIATMSFRDMSSFILLDSGTYNNIPWNIIRQKPVKS
jgi:hypothetical protein